MIKFFFRTLLSLIFLLLILVAYLSTIGLKTDKFNSKIISQIKQIDQNIEVKLNKVSIKLDLLKLGLNIKTIGTDLNYKNKIIKIETIESKISLKTLLNNKFLLSDISISTKPLVVRDLISFIRLFNNDPKLFVAEKFIKKGFVIADLKLEFDNLGNIKKNYKFDGLIKEGKVDIFGKYDLDKIDFIFKINQKEFNFNKIKFNLNGNNISIPNLILSKQDNQYFVSGKLNTKNTSFTKNEINNLINNKLLPFNIDEILFNSNNDFSFEINKNLKVKNLNVKSVVDIDKLKLKNYLKLEEIFPKIRKDIIFTNQDLKIEYKKNDLKIIGSGPIYLQKEIDNIDYEIYRKNKEYKFKTKLKIQKNPFRIDILNYEKNKNIDLELSFLGKKIVNDKLVFDKIDLKEKDKVISIKNLILSHDNRINDLGDINLNYTDKNNIKNILEIKKNNNEYLVLGNSFNIDNIIDEFLNSKNNRKLKLFDKDFKMSFKVKKIYLNKEDTIYNLKGFLLFNKNKISELDLESKFSNDQNIKFTIKDNGIERVTTLYSHKAKPFVDRYKFIKGFENGDLDFYSIKKGSITNSTLKVDNFKIQQIPVLAKLLTLASLQGIADLLTGEGIRFTDFEMKFSNKDELMTIDEIYAIGPAISILLEGYIQSKNLISLRGTLVPATTVNRTISSIPIIGNILVGKKVGEGVFGVSFKIKGPPGNLETTVNPIKTLTPRFITRTLEKIKN